MAIAEHEMVTDEEVQPEAGAVETVAAPVSVPAAVEKPEKGKRKKQAAAPAPADPVPAPAAAAPAPARRTFRIPGYVYWLLLAVALTVGGFWLVLNPQVITQNINQPYALLAGPALVVSVLALWLTIKFFTAIERGIKAIWASFLAARKEDGSAQFFWIVIAVFLVVSVFASGSFFSTIEHDSLPGLGYATALFIDLIAVQCMRARLNAGRLRDRRGQALYLMGVLICAVASAWANVYTSLIGFIAPTGKGLGALPDWMPVIAPWFGLVFPLLIVLLSMTADYTLDQTSSKLDPESYKVIEGKRVKLLEYQRDLLRKRVEIDHDIDDLTDQLRGRKERRVFFLVAWFFPLQLSGKQLLARVEALYQPQVAALTQQNEALRVALTDLNTNSQGAYNGLLQAVQALQMTVDSQRDTDNRLIGERIEGLAADLRSLAPASQVDGLASELRQEMRSMTPAKTKVNYTELARALAPILGKQVGLIEVNSVVDTGVHAAVNGRVPGDTDELNALDIEVLTSLNGSEGAQSNEVENEGQEADIEALLQQTTVSIKEAALIIGKDVKYVRTLRDRHNLKATPRNTDLITVTSLKTYLAGRSVKA